MSRSRKLTRRKFLLSLAVTTAGMLTAGQADSLKAESGDVRSHQHHHTQHQHTMDMNPVVDRYPRRNVDPRPSAPPRPMGKQMGRVVTPSLPALGYGLDGKVKVFELIAQPVETAIVEQASVTHTQHMDVPHGYERFQPRPSQAKNMLAWGYNGICPGPTLEAMEGDRVRIILRNELPEPTSIHWHGFELPFSQDGASGYHPFEARRPVPHGQAEVYEFDLSRQERSCTTPALMS